MKEASDDDDDPEDKPAPATSNFLSSAHEDATGLIFTDFSALDEPVPGESDDDDDALSWAGSAARRRRRGRSKRNHRRIVVSLVNCKYDVVAQAARALGWRCTAEENEEYNLLWNDSYVPFDTIAGLNKYQKTNHFPGMSELAKKNLLAKNLNRIARALPGEFSFVPPTFILPGEAEPLKNWFSSQARAAPWRRAVGAPTSCAQLARSPTHAARAIRSSPPARRPSRARRSGGRRSSSSRTRAARAAAFSSPSHSTSASR